MKESLICFKLHVLNRTQSCVLEMGTLLTRHPSHSAREEIEARAWIAKWRRGVGGKGPDARRLILSSVPPFARRKSDFLHEVPIFDFLLDFLREAASFWRKSKSCRSLSANQIPLRKFCQKARAGEVRACVCVCGFARAARTRARVQEHR